MKCYYKGVLCRLSRYRVMGEDRPALYYIDSPDQESKDTIIELFP